MVSESSFFTANNPLILFHVAKALFEGRTVDDAVKRCWKIDKSRASKYSLVVAKDSNHLVGVFRIVPGSWRPCGNGRWEFECLRADDLWDEYVGKLVPEEFRGIRNPVRYLPA